MPLELGIWRIDGKLVEVPVTSLDQERRLEDLLARDIAIASPNWLVIGRQVRALGGFIDLLAIDRDGKLIVIELKRDRTPRDVVAQLFDYASWVKTLDESDIPQIYSDYRERFLKGGAESFDVAYRTRFGVKAVPQNLNESHELVIVASALDDSTERIVTYLSETWDVPVNAVFFRVFRDGDREYLTRAWFRDPTGVSQACEPVAPQAGPWNGEFYVSFYDGYDWEQARKYGYIAAGGGEWYSRTLQLLKPGARIWVYSPGNGYVGVGTVTGEKMTAREFMVTGDDGRRVPIASLPTVAKDLMQGLDEPGKENFMIPVQWLKTVPVAEAFKETGFFSNQNSVCMPKVDKWDHTVERLKKLFGVE